MGDSLKALFVLGSTHHQASLEVREQLALSPEKIESLQHSLINDGTIRECLVVNTCNRLELYGLANPGELCEAYLRDTLSRAQGVSRELLDQHSFWHTNLNVLQHTLEVCAGLDSQIVGETEILGQMKRAFATAKAGNYTGPVLNRLFEKSFQAAKTARTQTGISRGQISIGNVAVDLASRIFGQLDQSRVLLLGSGEVGEKTAQALKSRGACDISVSSRTYEHAHRLAHVLKGATIDFKDFSEHLHHFDIVIASTAAPGLLLDQARIRDTMRSRPERPLFLIDLAMPRDIDPRVDELENVYLYNLDDLSTITNENLAARRSAIEQARKILQGQAWNLWLQLRRRELMRQS